MHNFHNKEQYNFHPNSITSAAEMSVTISNCDEICRSPTNQSPTKQLYTFPKESRFVKSKNSTYIYV